MSPDIANLADLVEIGRGGFGVVYQARQVDLGRLVAVKVLPDVRGDSEAYGRFARECQALAALGGHPNIATVFGCGLTDDGAGYLSMELLTGGSLADRVAGGGSAWAAVAGWGVALCGALETAHRAGITHRDIKPENVIFDGLGTPKLLDFGIAGVPGAFRTTTGAVTLTLAHAAPEVVAGGRGGVPGDVYSLASTLYAALAGGAAFVAAADETLVPMLARIASASVPDLRPRGVPDAVCSAIERGMAKDPADRPASAEAFGMALQAALAGEGVTVPAPPLLLVPGLAAAYITGEQVPDAAGVAATSGAFAGDRTVTGWTAPPAAELAAATAATTVVPTAAVAERRRTNGWALVAGLAVAALGLVAWRGLDLANPVVAGGSTPGPGATTSASGTPTPRASQSAHPASSTTARASSPTSNPPTGHPTPAVVAFSSTPFGSTPAALRTSATPSSPQPSSSTPTPAPSTTPPVQAPGAPRTVRVGAPAQVAGTGGAAAQIALSVSWLAPLTGSAPASYSLRWTVVGGAHSGAVTVIPWSSATSARVQVQIPDAASWIRWEVRATGAGTAGSSRWVVARVTMPRVVGRRVANARNALRAIGVSTAARAQTTTVAASVGRVLAQSVPGGRVITPGTLVTLTVGKKP